MGRITMVERVSLGYRVTKTYKGFVTYELWADCPIGWEDHVC